MKRAALTVAVLNLIVAMPAQATEMTAIANSPVAFSTPRVVARQGDTLRFRNLDPLAGHDLDSVQKGLFGTPVITLGQTALAEGVEKLAPGDYGFLCTVHPNMTGTLTILAGGSGGGPGPVPDPGGFPAAPNPVGLLPKARAEPLGDGDWPSYGHDLSNSRNGGASGPSWNEVPRLAPVWIHASDDGDFTGTPVVADGLLVAGSSGGTVFALDAATGAVRWRRDFGKPINASAAIVDGVVYIPLVEPGGPSLVALATDDGQVLWESELDNQPTADTYGSPAVWDGKVFMGTSGYFGEQVSEADVQARGSVVALDAGTGARLWKTYTVPEGHDGGAVWSTPAIDTQARRLYVGTGNAYHQPAAAMTDSMLVLDPDTGAVLDHFQAVAGDAWNGAEDWPQNPDGDFGSSPNLIAGPDGRLLVGQAAKTGRYWALDRATMDPVWSTITGPGSFIGGTIGSTAIDDGRIYGSNTHAGLVWALDHAGGLKWASSDLGPVHWGATAVANGVVYGNDTTGTLVARDAKTGAVLARLPLGAPTWGGVSVAGGSVFSVTGTGGTPGYILAFRPA